MKKILPILLLLVLSGCVWPGVDTKTKGYKTIPPPAVVPASLLPPPITKTNAPRAVIVPPSRNYKLTWTAPESGMQYEVWRTLTIPATWTKLATVSTNFLAFSATNRIEGFRVRALDPRTGFTSDWATTK